MNIFRKLALHWRAGLLVWPLLLSSCMQVGPDFKPEKAPAVSSYTAKPLPNRTVSTPSIKEAGKAQHLTLGEDIQEEWWRLFQSAELNAFIQRGLANNLDFKAAYATLQGAQEALHAQIGNSFFPAINLSPTLSRQKFSDATIAQSDASSIFNLFNASVNVSYILDVFGGERRQVEALQAQVDYQQFVLVATYLTLTANIATTAITISALQEQIDVTQQLLKDEEDQLGILRKQFNLGGIDRATVLTQETLVNQTRATLPPLEKSISQSKHALLALMGEYPNESLPRLSLHTLTLPADLPVSLPSDLVRQRPDVRANEALLHVASAQIGVATANLFPQFIINGNYGWEANIPVQLFSKASNVWDVAGQITQPIFHGGALFALRRQAIAAYNEAHANYQQVVLKAFHDVSNTLRALEEDAHLLHDQKEAENAAFNNLKLTKQQYRLGGASYLSLLNAQTQYQTTRLNRIEAQAARYTDTVALFQALGGGWWHHTFCDKKTACY